MPKAFDPNKAKNIFYNKSQHDVFIKIVLQNIDCRIFFPVLCPCVMGETCKGCVPSCHDLENVLENVLLQQLQLQLQLLLQYAF